MTDYGFYYLKTQETEMGQRHEETPQTVFTV